MSSFLAPINQDPPFLFLKPVQKPVHMPDKSLKLVDVEIKVTESLKPKLGGFDLLTLVANGQLTLLQISDKFGVLFLAYGPELIVVKNTELNQVLTDGILPVDKLLEKGKNQTHSNPIAFLKVSDEANCLFLQHSGDDYLLIADLAAVISDPKKGLQSAKRVKMDLDSVDVRQMSVCPGAPKLATVVSRNRANDHMLILVNYGTAAVTHRKSDITSAVFSANGQSIIAGKDAMDENLLVLDLSLIQKNAIKLSFPDLHEDIEIDDFRVLWVCEPYKNNYIVFAAYFCSQDDLDDNIGKTMMVWMGDELAKPGLSLDSLKQSKKVKACFWDFDHQDDDLIPSFNLEWYENPASDQVVGIAMFNHSDQPYMFDVTGGNLKECYELTQRNQLINRPVDPDTDEVMDPQETLGACLGFQILRTKMAGAPDIVDMTLIPDEGEEKIPYPQTLLFYSLNGVVTQYQLFIRDWRFSDLLKRPEALAIRPPQQAMPDQAAAQLGQKKPGLFAQAAAAQGISTHPAAQESAPQKKPGLLSQAISGQGLANATKMQQPQATTNPLYGGPKKEMGAPGGLFGNSTLSAKPSEASQFVNQAPVKTGLYSSAGLNSAAASVEALRQNQSLPQQVPAQQMSQPGQQQPPMTKPPNWGMPSGQQSQSMVQPQVIPRQQPQAPPKPKTREQMLAELFASFTNEMRLAMVHENNFSTVFNEQVVAKMNAVAIQFPDKTKLLDEMESQQAGFITMLGQAIGDQKTRQEIKECLDQTHRSFLAMQTNQKLCERLKREAKYGICGDQNVSVASPHSDLMKLNKTYKEFILDADYDEPDKQILLEIFDAGEMAIDNFDRLVKHFEMQETLRALYQARLKQTIGEKDAQKRTQMTSGVSFAIPAVSTMTADEKFRQRLEQNAGIKTIESDQCRVSAQAYTLETTKHLREHISLIEKEYDLVQASLNRKEVPVAKTKNLAKAPQKKTKFGEDDEDEALPNQNTSFKLTENELKHEEEVQQKKEMYRKMVRDRKRQKEMQRKLLAQAHQPKVCRLELNPIRAQAPQAPLAQAAQNSSMVQAVKQFQQSSAQISTASKAGGGGQSAVNKDKQKIAQFLNMDERQREQSERNKFIAALDSELITSPHESPKPKNALGRFINDQKDGGGPAQQTFFADGTQPKPLMSMLPTGKSDLLSARNDSNAAKTQNSFAVRSFGSKTSGDALQTQFSSKVAQQMSFGDEPKQITSLQKNTLGLDQIKENDSPTLSKAKNLAQAPRTPPSNSGPKTLQKQPTFSKLKINVTIPEKKDAAEDTPKTQKTVAFGGQKPESAAGIFGNLSIGKKPAEPAKQSQPEKPKEDEKKPNGLFGASSMPKQTKDGAPEKQKEEDSKKQEPPKTSLFGNGLPANTTASKENSAKPTTSLFAGAKPTEGATKTASKPETQSDALPKTGLFGSAPKAQPGTSASPTTALFGAGVGGFGQPQKPKEDAIAAMSASGSLAQPAPGQPAAPGGQKLSWGGFQNAKPIAPLGPTGATNIFGGPQAQAQPQVFGQVNIGQKNLQSQKPPEAAKPFGSGFGGASGEQKPMSFSSGGGQGNAGGFLKFGNPAPQGAGIFGGGGNQPQQPPMQQQPFGGFGGAQPQMQQQPMMAQQQQQQQMQQAPQPLSFGNAAPQQQPQAMFGGGGQPSFSGFGGGGAAPLGGGMQVSAAMLKPRK